VFHAEHGNLMTEELSEESLGTARTKMRVQTEPNGNRIGLVPRLLVIPPELELVARRILSSTTVPQPDGSEKSREGSVIKFGQGWRERPPGDMDYMVGELLTDANGLVHDRGPQEGSRPGRRLPERERGRRKCS